MDDVRGDGAGSVLLGKAYLWDSFLSAVCWSRDGLSIFTSIPSRSETLSIWGRFLAFKSRSFLTSSGRRCWPTVKEDDVQLETQTGHEMVAEI